VNRALIADWLRRLPLGRGPTILAGLVVVAGGVVATPLVLSRLGGGGEDLRADLYTIAIRMFGSFPLTGVGPGNR
jgi:O-antigen ligase